MEDMMAGLFVLGKAAAHDMGLHSHDLALAAGSFLRFAFGNRRLGAKEK